MFIINGITGKQNQIRFGIADHCNQIRFPITEFLTVKIRDMYNTVSVKAFGNFGAGIVISCQYEGIIESTDDIQQYDNNT